MLTRLLGGQWFAIGLVGAVSFALSIFIARSFGPEVFSVYALAISISALLSILIDGGFGKPPTRKTVRVSTNLSVFGEKLHVYAFGHTLLTMSGLCLLVMFNPLPYHRLILLATLGAFTTAVLGLFCVARAFAAGCLVAGREPFAYGAICYFGLVFGRRSAMGDLCRTRFWREPVRSVRGEDVESEPSLCYSIVTLSHSFAVNVAWSDDGDLFSSWYGVAQDAWYSKGGHWLLWPARGLLKVLHLPLVFALANGVLSQAALAWGMEWVCVVAATLVAVFNVMGNLLLLPVYGAYAAAMMTVVTEFVLGVCISAGLFLRWKSARATLSEI